MLRSSDCKVQCLPIVDFAQAPDVEAAYEVVAGALCEGGVHDEIFDVDALTYEWLPPFVVKRLLD